MEKEINNKRETHWLTNLEINAIPKISHLIKVDDTDTDTDAEWY